MATAGKSQPPSEALQQLISTAPSETAAIPSATIPPETEAPWSLPLPEDLPETPECPGVSYRIVHESVYAARVLYVRSGPGTDYPVIGRLSQGASLARGAVGNNGWSQVLFEGQEAYAATIHLSVTPVMAEKSPAESSVTYEPVDDLRYAVETNKLRTGPGFEYAVIGHLVKGNGARRVAEGSNGWSRILFHDTEAYACTAFLSAERPAEPDSNAQPHYEETNDQVYTSDHVNIRSGPGTDYPSLGQTEEKQCLQRLARGSNGWSKILWEDREAFIYTPLISPEPPFVLRNITTQEPEFPTPQSPFLFQYVAPENIMPFGIFTPAEKTGDRPLPLILSLHGALEIGEGPDTLKSNFLTKEIRNWEYTGLQGFQAIVVCPQLTGCALADSWSEPETADRFFELLAYLQDHYNIDASRISIEGHSLGGQGALYMAADPRASFSKVVLISAYDPLVPYGHVSAQVKGFTGSPYLPVPREDWTSYHFMQQAFSQVFGIENFTMKNCSHYDIPMVALHEDADNDGRSDLIEWMISE